MTKLICILAVGFAAALNLRAESNGDAAWAQIVQAKKANVSATELADKLQAFYKAYPQHPKATDAWIKEQSLRPQAAAKPATVAPPTGPVTINTLVQDAHARIRKAQAASPEAGLGEMERSGRKLATDYPKHPAGWEILLTAAKGFGGEKGRQLYNDVAANAPTPQLKAAAVTGIRTAAAPPRLVGIPVAQNIPALPKIKPISLAFTATDGRQINLSQYAGKVVLIDFWATWCGPCVAEMPNVKAAYNQLHAEGFEIIGISLDSDRRALQKYVEQNQIPWTQYYDGAAWDNAIGKQFDIRSIPTMYLVDKNGILRDTSARENLQAKVRMLLKE